MRIFDIDTPAGRALELVSDLVKQGRMSSAERRVIEELIWHPDMPESLRTGRRTEITIIGSPRYPYPGSAGDVPFAPPATSIS